MALLTLPPSVKPPGVGALSVRPLGRPRAGRVVAADQFNRADSTTTLGSDAFSRTWTCYSTGGAAASAVFGIKSNGAYCQSGSSSDRIAVVDATLADDYRLISDIVFGSASGTLGFAFRVQDGSNYLMLRASYSGGAVQFFHTLAGVRTAGASSVAIGAAFTQSRTYRFELIVSGPWLRFLIDGAEVLATLDTTLLTGTGVGLATSNSATNTNVWDSFRQEQLG